MSLYYQDEFVELHHGDCRSVEAWTSADVLITDPPYGVGYQSAWVVKAQRRPLIAGDTSAELRDRMLAIWGDKPALVFGSWRVPRPESVRARLLWVKGDDCGIGDLSLPWGNGDEEIYVLGNGWTGPRRTNVYRMPKLTHWRNPGHPTPKPVALMEALVEYAPAGLIADPFAGSGSTLLAARNLGRRVVGVEIEERYCEVIAKRLSQQAFNFAELEAGDTPRMADGPRREAEDRLVW